MMVRVESSTCEYTTLRPSGETVTHGSPVAGGCGIVASVEMTRVSGSKRLIDHAVFGPDVDLHRVGTLAKLHKTVKLPNVNNVVVFVEGVARIRLNGVCGCCPSTVMTVIMGIEQELRKHVPEVRYLEAVV
jgi:hypothetical protein